MTSGARVVHNVHVVAEEVAPHELSEWHCPTITSTVRTIEVEESSIRESAPHIRESRIDKSQMDGMRGSSREVRLVDGASKNGDGDEGTVRVIRHHVNARRQVDRIQGAITFPRKNLINQNDQNEMTSKHKRGRAYRCHQRARRNRS